MSDLQFNVQMLSLRPCFFEAVAEMAELVDAQDLKSCVQKWTCGFDSRFLHSFLSSNHIQKTSDEKPRRCVLLRFVATCVGR